MGRKSKFKGERVSGGFALLPWVVFDSRAYRQLRDPARAVLMELARQIRPDQSNNGQLILTDDYLAARGKFDDKKVARAVKALIASGLVHMLVQGHRPNKASWYAVTWFSLAPSNLYDYGAAETFRKGAYLDGEPLPKPKPTREELFRKWDQKNDSCGGLEPVGARPVAGSRPVEGLRTTGSQPAMERKNAAALPA